METAVQGHGTGHFRGQALIVKTIKLSDQDDSPLNSTHQQQGFNST